MEPIRILSTRPLEAVLLEQAEAKGMRIDTLPFIMTEAIEEPALKLRLPELARRPIVAIFTSMNAVEAVAEQLGLTGGTGTANDRPAANARPPEADRPGKMNTQPAAGLPGGIDTQPAAGWKIFCIGYATQQLVRQHFGEGSIAGTAASAAALADVVIGQSGAETPGEVFFFCGDQRRDELPEKLQQFGFRVQELVVYRTVRTPHKVEVIYDSIVFFSPSAVHSFFMVNTLPADTILFAIGQTTADVIRSYATNRILLSGSPEKEALIRQVIDYYTSKQ